MILRSRLPGLGSTSPYAATVAALAPSYGVPPSLALAVMNQESGGNQFAPSGSTLTSSAGALGLFQLMPATAAGLGVNPNDPTQNIQGGLKYLQQMYAAEGNWNDALVAYNEGPGAFAAHGAYPGAASYASSILNAAGLDSSSTTTMPELSTEDGSDGTDTSGDTSGGGGLSGTTVAILAAGILGIALIAAR